MNIQKTVAVATHFAYLYTVECDFFVFVLLHEFYYVVLNVSMS